MNKILLLTVLLFFSAFGMIYGQSDQDRITRPRPVLDRDVRDSSEIDDGLTLPRQLMSQGAYISAAGLLEDIYASNPEDREAVNLLLNCYFELKAYAKAELLLQRLLERYPLEYPYLIRLFELYLKSGVDSTISFQADDILRKYPGNPDIYRSLITKLIEYGFNDKALEIVEKGRREFSNNSLFALERATLFENRGEYFNAVMEYYGAADQDSLMKAQADRKIATLIRYPGATDEVIRALNHILDSLPDNIYVMKLLQEAYVRAERFDDAFNISIARDSLTEIKGRELYAYLRDCFLRKLNEQVIKMAEYIETRDFSKDEISQYRFHYGEALLAVGRVRDAIGVYHKIIEQYPLPRDKAMAALAIANAYRYNLKIYDTARVYYDSAATAYNFSPVRFSSWLEIARLHIIDGRLDSAETAFSRLLIDGDAEERRELISYNLAMILFYEKQYGAADLAFRKIINDFPRGFYTNDALINSLIIREAQASSPEALDLYADAIYYDARMMPDSMESRFSRITSMGQSSLTGLTMLRLAEHYCRRGDTASALTVIDKMAANYAGDYFFPYTLKLKGDIFAADPVRVDEAAQIYRDLLQNYGSYPFTGEVREALQNIEKNKQAS
ncbi:MAG: tetratricopeptide repeat protein [Candidatus Zixiibacteriota bacterium]